MTYTRFTVGSTPSLWRVTFNHPPINLIDSVMIGELGELFAEVERNEGPAVVVFDSADMDYFLAHYDITTANRSLVDSLPPGPTGFHPWIDLLVRLSKLPAVTISAIRGRARGAGSEFVLACDIRFASRERAILGQFEVGVGAAPGGGALNRLSSLVGRARAFEILVSGQDFDGELAELYGYVNRAIPDAQFVDSVDAFAQRVSRFDLLALADIKRFVNAATLPADEPLAAEIDAFWKAAERPAFPALHSLAFKAGYSQRGPVELNLGEFVGTILADPDSYPTR